jgi:hypothetical protein
LIALATMGAVGVLALDRLVLSPLMAASDALDVQLNKYRQDLADGQGKLASRQHRTRRWAEMLNSGLRRKDASEAESQLLNNIRDWAQEAGMTLLSVKPERSEREKGFSKSTFRVTGSGGMEQISRFLWHIQTAGMPARIADLQMTTRKEATDDLSLQLGISTIYLLPDSEKEQPASGAGSARPREVQP